MIYFASDFHLGAPDAESSKKREHIILDWLESIEKDVEELFLVGDIFDFWFEYKTVIPKGFIRLQGKLASLADRGVAIHYFSGNHDLWLGNYFQEELGILVYHKPQLFERKGKYFFVGHGDGLGPGDTGYKIMKKIFRARWAQWLYRWVHPDIGVRLASYFSRRSRASQGYNETFLGAENEWLLQYANRKLAEQPQIDYFIFGHRHLPLDVLLDNQKSRYVNLGEWFKARSFARWDGTSLDLLYFEAQ